MSRQRKISVVSKDGHETIVNYDVEPPVDECSRNGEVNSMSCADFEENMKLEEEDLDLPVPPDGGWGWVVVLASLMVNIIVDGVCFSFGIIYPELLAEFGESSSKTLWIGSLIPGMYLGTGNATIINMMIKEKSRTCDEKVISGRKKEMRYIIFICLSLS